MADVAKDDDEVHGFKLVRRDTYAPIYIGNSASQRYIPGTTQWIEWEDWTPPPPLKLCSRHALHFCRRAMETVEFIPHTLTIDDLALLRVTPVRWQTAHPDTPLFVEEQNASQPAKCGARGLRVDGEVTDVDERRALLSGEIETEMYLPHGKCITTVVDGRIVTEQKFDLLGNCVSTEAYRYNASTSSKTVAVTQYSYALYQTTRADGKCAEHIVAVPKVGEEIGMEHAFMATEDIIYVAKNHYRGNTVVYGEILTNFGRRTLRIVKRYTLSNIENLVAAAIKAKEKK